MEICIIFIVWGVGGGFLRTYGQNFVKTYNFDVNTIDSSQKRGFIVQPLLHITLALLHSRPMLSNRPIVHLQFTYSII